MKIDITGRQVDVTDGLREHAEEKLAKLDKLLDGPLEAHVVLAISKHRHIAEIQVKSRHLTLSGTEETGDLYASIGQVVDKLERQALKHKEKIRNHKHRKGPRDPEVAAAIEATAAEAEPGAEEASSSYESAPRIVPGRRYRVKPLSAEDAVLELEASGEDILVFREAGTNRINVIHRQTDGSFALVDPEL